MGLVMILQTRAVRHCASLRVNARVLVAAWLLTLDRSDCQALIMLLAIRDTCTLPAGFGRVLQESTAWSGVGDSIVCYWCSIWLRSNAKSVLFFSR